MNLTIFILFLLILFLIILLFIKNKEFFYNKKELKFIHITKNAGTYIEDTAKKSNILFGKHHKEYGNIKNGISPWHHIFPNVNKNVKDKYDWFMVVRNPYDRILSEYYCQQSSLARKITDKKEMNNYLINKIKKRSKVGNHYTEQYKYLDSNYNIHIIKYEDMIPELSQLYKEYGLNIELIDKKINSSNIKKFTIKDFNNELITLINSVYKEDFKIFGYKK
jgi:hypothetical protein